ncbi:FAD/NAD(P)-binding protein [Streptomyces niveiscabiei]|uniref:FAD/NAD(P)-binding protein n=1 Tax=Streptomyces niveiscabiei TaxID=164115 RepID=UPI0029A22476|nr:FAD/NAD(P)-binding protein [Streptomyces niveiscabiei]MDX3388304.1 FAD/NAD(P)-binding protein [Streptomyces niveiscabiei]
MCAEHGYERLEFWTLDRNTDTIAFTSSLPEVPIPRRWGPELAFATPEKLHLLNVRADRMSLRPDDKGEFARWRERNAASWAARMRAPERGWDDYPPRRLFGSYTRAVLADVSRDSLCIARPPP